MLNNVVLMGRITHDLELRHTQSNDPKAYISFRIAVNRQFKDKDGKQEADFINIKAFGKTAEFVNKYFGKGKMIAVAGRIQTGSYKNKDGDAVYTFDVMATNVTFTGEKSDENSKSNDGFYPIEDDIDDDDLPF